MKTFFVRRWFLMALAVVLVSGFSFSQPLQPVARGLPRNWIVAVVMFVMAFPLDASSMWKAVRYPKAVLLAVSVNYVLLPLFAWGVALTLAPVMRDDLRYGLLIAGAVPSTVASAAVWTRRAGGNDAISLLVTMITNVSCFIVTPAWLYVTAGAEVAAGGGQTLDPGKMMLRLCLIVVIPVLTAQMLRLYAPLGIWATRRKIKMGVICQLGMLTMVFCGCIRAGDELRKANGAEAPRQAGGRLGAPEEGGGDQPTLKQDQPNNPEQRATTVGQVGVLDWTLMLASVLCVHLTMLATAHLLGRGLGIARPDRIAAGFSGSQKTLLVGLDVAAEYVDVFGGLALLPMVAYHVSQLLVDTFIADRLRRRGEQQEQEQSSPV